MVTPTPSGWQPSRLVSRTGAAHQRRGAACQDACGWLGCRDGDGAAVQVLAVSDGHGGSRYRRSDAGSRLACAVALGEAARCLAAASTADPAAAGSGAADWADWFARLLPARILPAWRQAVKEHRRQLADGADAQGEEEDPLLAYGATLGLLVLTPRWWGYTGLGDWDLVRVKGPDNGKGRRGEEGGSAELLSEEAALEGGGEATFSLCLRDAEQRFAPRSGLHRLDPAQAPFQLLLCTDGIRKSCGCDGDFLTLACHLAALPAGLQPDHDPALAEALDHISREGSGDDVSAVIGSWGPLTGEMNRSPLTGRGGPLIIQPPPPGTPTPEVIEAGGALQPPPGDGVAALQDTLQAALLPQESAAGPSLRESGVRRAQRGEGLGEAPDPLSAGADRSASSGTWSRWLLAALVLLGLTAACGALLAWWQKTGPFAAAPEPPLLTAEQRSALRRQVEELCGATLNPQLSPAAGQNERIRATLNQRRSTFAELAVMTPAQIAEAKADLLQRDPLTALITLSRLAPPAVPSLRQPSSADGINPSGDGALGAAHGRPSPAGAAEAGPAAAGAPAAGAATAAATDALAGLPICPELQRGLAEQWAHQQPWASTKAKGAVTLSR